VAVDDGGGEVDQLAVADTRLIAKHLEGVLLIDGMPFHQDALGTLDRCAAAERALEVAELGESAQHDVNRALPIVDVIVADVGKNASF